MDLIVRRTVVAYIPAFPAIELSAGGLFRDTDRAWVADAEPTPLVVHREAIAAGHHWTALVDDDPVGFLLAEQFGTALYIAELAVARPFQRKGVGRALMIAAEGYATDAAYAELTLTTYRDLPWNGPFYQKLGFRELPPEALPFHLAARLGAEAEAGHEPHLRCGMAKPLG